MANAEDRRRLSARLRWLRAGVYVAFGALAGVFWFFQVVQHQKFEEMAANNHQRTLPLRAPRGVIYDRNGEVLVENRSAFNISIVREQTRDLDRTIRLLAQVTGIEEARIRDTVDRHRREPTYRPIVVVQDATLAQVAAVTARRLDTELPDVVVQEVPTRQYPREALAAHLIGYVGEASDQQMLEDGLGIGAIVGQSGLERVYNRMLMGADGARRVVVNSVGREIRTLEELPPTEGQRVRVSINAAMQRAAEDAFRAYGYWGAAVVLDPRSGDVLTLTSLPAYDPNAFSTGIDRQTWAALNTDKLRPLQNRAIQGRYSPGSTFKIVVATAALEEGLVTPDYKVFCNGGASFYGRFFQCLGRHGWMDMRHAIEKSCNTYFYTLGNMVGVDRLYDWSEKLGLAGKSGIDLPNEIESIVPSTEWKKQRTGERWYPGETISVAIGQGQLSVTPMSMAVMMATAANGGTRHVPRLVKEIDAGDGRGWQPVPPPDNPFAPFDMKPETIAALHDGLWLAVNGAGTAGRARISGRDVSGKTGTAQVISLQGKARAGATDKDLRDHGWFVFFAPRDNPEVAGVVFAEHSEHGYLAAPIARHVMETYFAQRDGLPLPELRLPASAAPVPAPAPAAPSRAAANTAAAAP
ncbi:MAG: penicillin-binding protein 2 [Acidobacteria bacterium]|nr:penicillin-binding protein 2 [Acidobacteriota bacterium]